MPFQPAPRITEAGNVYWLYIILILLAFPSDKKRKQIPLLVKTLVVGPLTITSFLFYFRCFCEF
jgi:hypothetical protein